MRLGVTLGHDEAARKIQAAIRGWLWRRRIRKEADKELMFIGMKPKVRGGGASACGTGQRAMGCAAGRGQRGSCRPVGAGVAAVASGWTSERLG